MQMNTSDVLKHAYYNNTTTIHFMNVFVSEQKRRVSECKNMVLKSNEEEEENNVNGILMMCTLMIRNCR